MLTHTPSVGWPRRSRPPRGWRGGLLHGILAVTLLAGTIPGAQAASTDPMLTLKPHCILQNKKDCPQFQAVDASTQQTGVLKQGDILDVDVVLLSSQPADVTTIRSWLKYDPNVLEARSIELQPALSAPFPDEQTIDQADGLVKIGGGTLGRIATNETSIARVTFRLLQSTAGSQITFEGFKPEGGGDTSLTKESGGTSTALLQVQPSALIIQTDASASPSLISSSTLSQSDTLSTSSAGTIGATTSAPAPAAGQGSNSAFALLQVQDVRVTSRDSSAYLGWQPIHSSDLAGYNVYYGSVSGRYVQRHTIDASAPSLVIGELQPGAQEFFAVRGFDAAGNETAFSQEVSVVIGRPETSTAPLVAGGTTTPVRDNPVSSHGGSHVSGTTGLGSDVLILIFFSAIIGTFFAAQRQFKFTRFIHTASHLDNRYTNASDAQENPDQASPLLS